MGKRPRSLIDVSLKRLTYESSPRRGQFCRERAPQQTPETGRQRLRSAGDTSVAGGVQHGTGRLIDSLIRQPDAYLVGDFSRSRSAVRLPDWDEFRDRQFARHDFGSRGRDLCDAAFAKHAGGRQKSKSDSLAGTDKLDPVLIDEQQRVLPFRITDVAEQRLLAHRRAEIVRIERRPVPFGQ